MYLGVIDLLSQKSLLFQADEKEKDKAKEKAEENKEKEGK